MNILRLTMLVLYSTLLVACSNLDTEGLQPASFNYCDNFLIYDMCARDTNRDGVVDYVYFTDSEEIFMFREGADRRFPADLLVHECAQMMDDDLVATTSRLLFIDEETGYLERQDIRGAMMIKYIAYMPEVTACNMRNEEVQSDQSGS